MLETMRTVERMDRLGYYLISVVMVFLAGFMLGRGSMRPKPLGPMPEKVIDEAGTRIIKRELMKEEPREIAPGAGIVQSDTVVRVQAIAAPETITEIHFQEVTTPQGPRIVVEAPEGFRVIDATETRRDPGSVVLSKPYSLGLAGKVGTQGAALGLAAGYSTKNWSFQAQGFRDSVTVGVLFRF